MFNTSARSAMDDLPAPREREPVAGPLYCHQYGGVARDVVVTREGFARFFEYTPEEVDFMEEINYVAMTMPDPWYNARGKISRKFPGGPIQYTITIINSDHSRVGELLKIAPYLLEEPCN